jgi:hypothetical protein
MRRLGALRLLTIAASFPALVGIVGCGDSPSATGGPSGNEPLLHLVRGDAQISSAGTELASPIVVRATNSHGKPLAGIALNWTATGDGQVAPDRLVTDDSGLVRAAWTLGTQLGRHLATATFEGQVVTFRATAAEPLSLGTVRHLRLATFDGSGQLVHPDVARVPRGWAAARRFLAVTPYPGGDVSRELPSVYASGDPSEWVAPNGVTNPIVKPWKGYLSDPDIVFEPQRKELWVYFRHVSRRNSVFLTVSGDGSHWSKPVRLLSAPNHELISPAVVRVGPGDWHMWSVNAGGSGCTSASTTVEHRTSVDGLHWSPPQPVDVSGPGELTPWHIDVLWVPELREYWALYNEKPSGTCATPALRLATSPDGITWTPRKTPVLRAGVMPEFRDIVYRSTLEYDARTDMVTLWYSGARTDGEGWTWSAAVERKSRSELFLMLDTPEPARRKAVARAAVQLLDAP